MKCTECGTEYVKKRPPCGASVYMRWLHLAQVGRAQMVWCSLDKGHSGHHRGAVEHQGKEEIYVEWQGDN